MPSENALGAYLRTRREQVSPAEVGLSALGPRRTSGLRREEVATLAGISVEYLIRLERGRDRRPSPSMVDSLARVLQLDDDARAHLAALADVRDAPPDEDDDVAPELVRLMESWHQPSIVMNRFMDLLAINDAGAALHADIGLRPGVNMARAFFGDPELAHRVYPDHDEIAEEVVGNLRSLAGGRPEHPRLIGLVGELSLSSEDFSRRWARAEVVAKANGHKRMRHPRVGIIDLDWTTLRVEAAPHQLLVAYQAEAGSVSERRLRELRDSRTRGIPSGQQSS